ncbi:hypothetical protein [Roseovarius atlanticus]|uniref:hypothetical protein n=1 Tax=Roseovarius atlanticus TaxID=1641875 RepID=UPI000A6FBEA9|nr:hypothetical protein [Roseovarius atlanticus]
MGRVKAFRTEAELPISLDGRAGAADPWYRYAAAVLNARYSDLVLAKETGPALMPDPVRKRAEIKPEVASGQAYVPGVMRHACRIGTA